MLDHACTHLEGKQPIISSVSRLDTPSHVLMNPLSSLASELSCVNKACIGLWCKQGMYGVCIGQVSSQ